MLSLSVGETIISYYVSVLIGAFFGAILMLMIYQLPVILLVRYGIDIWIWLSGVFGTKGVKVMTMVIILINFPWYAVCCDILGTVIAYRGVKMITWTTRISVPAYME